MAQDYRSCNPCFVYLRNCARNQLVWANRPEIWCTYLRVRLLGWPQPGSLDAIQNPSLSLTPWKRKSVSFLVRLAEQMQMQVQHWAPNTHILHASANTTDQKILELKQCRKCKQPISHMHLYNKSEISLVETYTESLQMEDTVCSAICTLSGRRYNFHFICKKETGIGIEYMHHAHVLQLANAFK